jgi:hypothetical protein
MFQADDIGLPSMSRSLTRSSSSLHLEKVMTVFLYKSPTSLEIFQENFMYNISLVINSILYCNLCLSFFVGVEWGGRA